MKRLLWLIFVSDSPPRRPSARSTLVAWTFLLWLCEHPISQYCHHPPRNSNEMRWDEMICTNNAMPLPLMIMTAAALALLVLADAITIGCEVSGCYDFTFNVFIDRERFCVSCVSRIGRDWRCLFGWHGGLFFELTVGLRRRRIRLSTMGWECSVELLRIWGQTRAYDYSIVYFVFKFQNPRQSKCCHHTMMLIQFQYISRFFLSLILLVHVGNISYLISIFVWQVLWTLVLVQVHYYL